MEWEYRLPYVERFVPHLQRMSVVAFRSGGGVTALLQASPPAAFQVILEKPLSGSNMSALGGRVPIVAAGVNPALGIPSDIAGVTRGGVTWYLVPETGSIVSRDVSGYIKVIATLSDRGTVRTACVVDSGSIAFLDDT